MTRCVINSLHVAWLVSVTVLIAPLANAHSPHHLITDVASAPYQASGSHTFILITDQVFRSDARGASWKHLVNGLSSRYSYTSIDVSPEYASDGTVFLASSGDGVYRSRDFGESWQKIVAGLGSSDISRLSVSDNFGTDRRLLAASGSGGVWRSVDGGESWQIVLTEVVVVNAFAEIQDENIVIAGDSDGKLWRSDDNGRLWEIVHEFSDTGAVTSVAGLGENIYVGTESGGLHQSTDGGRTFVAALLPGKSGRPLCQKGGDYAVQADAHITSVAVMPGSAGGHAVLATSWYGGVYVSRDNARSWSVWDGELSCDGQADRLSVPHFRDLEVTTFADGRSIYWLGAFDGLFRSVDEASSWQQQETLPLGLIKGMAVTGGEDQTLAVALATYGGGFYVTHDNGSTWTIGNKGLMTTRLTGMTFSPNYDEDDVIYAGAIRRLLKSSDRGQSWELIDLYTPGFGRRVLNKMASLGIGSPDSRLSRPIYPTHLVPLPDDGALRVLFGTRDHGVMTYVESTEDVEITWAGTKEVINSLAVSPGFARDKTLFASIRGEGVYRSNDGGSSWTAANRGLDFINDWARNPGRGDFRRDVYLSVAPDFSSSHTLFAGSPAADGLYVSHDSGDSWTRLTNDFGVTPAPVLAINLSPEFETDNSLIVSVNGTGLFRSRDRGKRFNSIGRRLVEDNAAIEHLAYSPNYVNDHSVVAASDETLYLSMDQGDSWSEVTRPVRYEDMRDVLVYEGGWKKQSGEQFSALTETVTAERGGNVSLRFVGGGIRLLGSKGPGYGSAEVLIDGKVNGTISFGSGESQHMQALFELRGLDPGPHIVEIRASGVIAVDALDVLP